MSSARSSGEPIARGGDPPGPSPRPWRPTPLLAASGLLHVAALPLLAAAPRLRLVTVAMLVADHALFTGVGLWPRSRLLGPNLVRLPEAAGAGARRVALTFDDGPDPEVTPRVLDVLDRHGARATFFCIGERVERHPETVAEVARRGHRVENHTHRHLARFSVLLPGGIAREVDRAQRAIEAATGRAPELFRPPAGFRSFLLEPLLARRGLALVSWTRRAYDTVRSDPARVARSLTRGLGPGEIVLLHDGRAAGAAAGRPVVLEALPRLLAHLAGEGLETSFIDLPTDHRPPARGE